MYKDGALGHREWPHGGHGASRMEFGDFECAFGKPIGFAYDIQDLLLFLTIGSRLTAFLQSHRQGAHASPCVNVRLARLQ